MQRVEDKPLRPLEPGPSTHGNHIHPEHEQPPVPGDVHPGGQPHLRRPNYTPDELAPRIEKFPIPPDQIIQLPKTRPRNLPKVQAHFSRESPAQKRIRLRRQAAIKRAMARSWEAYSIYAMGHDEVDRKSVV